MIAQFEPGSAEAEAAMRCVDELVIVPGYGQVDWASDDYVCGEHTVSVGFLDIP